MEHIAAFLLVIGCSQDLSQCRELPAPQPVFETVEDCRAELPHSYGRFIAGHKQLFAQCFEVDPELAETDVEIVWDVTSEGRLTASVEPVEDDGDLQIASARHHGAEGEAVHR